MPTIEVTDKDLFGHPAGTLSEGEFFAISHLLDNEDGIVGRAERCFGHLPVHPSLLLEQEDVELLNDAMMAYILGLYSVVILAADGFCERLLTDAIEARGDRRSARSGMGAVLRSAEKMKVLHPFIHGRVRRLHMLRNNLCHEKGPDDPFRLFRRSLAERTHFKHLLEADAWEALCIARGIAGSIRRVFPRLGLPGGEASRGEIS